MPVFVENFSRLWDNHYLTEHVKHRRKQKERREAMNMHGIGFNAAAMKTVSVFNNLDSEVSKPPHVAHVLRSPFSVCVSCAMALEDALQLQFGQLQFGCEFVSCLVRYTHVWIQQHHAHPPAHATHVKIMRVRVLMLVVCVRMRYVRACVRACTITRT